MKKAICKLLLFNLWGWKLKKTYPKGVRQSVVVVFPHTSNWDFPIGILLRPIMNEDIGFVGKSSLFKFPLGGIIRWLGGYAVDRSKHNNFVDAVAHIFTTEPDFKICITPEGTRKKVDKLKTGFYHIAMEAKVPLVLGKFDWGNKEISFSDPFYPTGDYAADMKQIAQFYKGVKGKFPKCDFDWDSLDA